MDHQQLQQFVTSSTWDHVEVRRRLAVWAQEFVDPDALAIDDTGFPKDGLDSPGVARMYCGASGKTGNCWIGSRLRGDGPMATSGRTGIAPVRAVDPRESSGTESDERAAQLFKALADPVRIRLVRLVRTASNGEECFCGLATEFDMPQPSLSHHLSVLVKAGVLSRERRGTWSWYRLCPEAWQALSAILEPGGLLVRRPATDPDSCR